MDRFIVVLAFVLGVFSMLTWEYFKEVHGVRIYYIGIALEFSLLYYAYSLTQTGKFRVLCDAITSVVVSKLFDELFFDPTKFEWVEVLITALGFIVLYVTGVKRLHRRNRKRKEGNESNLTISKQEVGQHSKRNV